MNAENLEKPENEMLLALQFEHERKLHNKMRLNTAYSSAHLQAAIEYSGPSMSFRMVLDCAIERAQFEVINYDSRRFYYRGIPIIREQIYD